MRHAILWVIALASFGTALGAVNAQTSPPAIDPQYLIVPGKSFGPIQLGGSIKEVVTLYGKEKYSNTSPNQPTSSYFEKPDLLVWTRDGKVVSVSGFDPAYKTDKGIGVGSTVEELRGAYGEPCMGKPSVRRLKGHEVLGQYALYKSTGLNALIDLRHSPLPTIIVIGNNLPGDEACP